jgi:hypothetical protein
VEDRGEDVDVAGGDRVEEAALDERHAVAERLLVADGLREVEDDPAEPRVPFEQPREVRAVAAADVDDRLVAAPFEPR